MEKLSSPALRDCPGKEELVSVLRKQRCFILQRGENEPSGCALRLKHALRAFCMSYYLLVQVVCFLTNCCRTGAGGAVFYHVPVCEANSHSHPHVSGD